MQPDDARPRRFTRILLEERLQPDVVLVNNVAAFAPSRYTRVHSNVAPEIPLVGVVHAWHQVTMKSDPEQARRNREAAQEALDRIGSVVFGSEHCRTEGIELGFSYPERQTVIPYPLQPAYMEPIDVGEPRRGVLFLGSLNARKNPMSLLEAVAEIDSLPLTFAGEGDEEPRLRRRAEELGVSDRVTFVPHQPQRFHIARMRELVRTSEVLCLPSRSESFGIVMIEALAAGTPVVGFGPTFTEIRERLGVEIGSPTWEGTPEEIEAGLRRALDEPPDRMRLRELTIAEFSPPTVAGRYADVVRAAKRSR